MRLRRGVAPRPIPVILAKRKAAAASLRLVSRAVGIGPGQPLSGFRDDT